MAIRIWTPTSGSLQSLAGSLNAGDEVQLRGGTYPQNGVLDITDANVTFGSYPGERATITGSGNRMRIRAAGIKLLNLNLHQTGLSEIDFENYSGCGMEGCDLTNNFGTLTPETHSIKCYIKGPNFVGRNNFFHQVGRPDTEDGGANWTIFSHAYYITSSATNFISEDDRFFEILGGYCFHFYSGSTSGTINRARMEDSYFFVAGSGCTRIDADGCAYVWNRGTTGFPPTRTDGQPSTHPYRTNGGWESAGSGATITDSVSSSSVGSAGSDGIDSNVSISNILVQDPQFASPSTGDFTIQNAAARTHLGIAPPPPPPPPADVVRRVPFKTGNWFTTPIPANASRVGGNTGAPVGLEATIQAEHRFFCGRYFDHVAAYGDSSTFFYCVWNGSAATADVYQQVVDYTNPDTTKRFKQNVPFKNISLGGNTVAPQPRPTMTPANWEPVNGGYDDYAAWYGVDSNGWPVDPTMSAERSSGNFTQAQPYGHVCIVVANQLNGRHHIFEGHGFNPQAATRPNAVSCAVWYDSRNSYGAPYTFKTSSLDNQHLNDRTVAGGVTHAGGLIKDAEIRDAYARWLFIATAGTLDAQNCPDLGHMLMVNIGQHHQNVAWAPANRGEIEAQQANVPQTDGTLCDQGTGFWVGDQHHVAPRLSHFKQYQTNATNPTLGCPNFLGRTEVALPIGGLFRFDPAYDVTTYRAPFSTGTNQAIAAAQGTDANKRTAVGQILARTLQRFGGTNTDWTTDGWAIQAQTIVNVFGVPEAALMFDWPRSGTGSGGDGMVAMRTTVEDMVDRIPIHTINTGPHFEAWNETLPTTGTYGAPASGAFPSSAPAPIYRPFAPPAAVTSVPPVPSGLTVTAFGQSLLVEWTPGSTTAANARDSYDLQRSKVATFDGATTFTFSVAGGADDFVDTGFIEEGTEYFYRIRSRNVLGVSAYSNADSDTTGSSTPDPRPDVVSDTRVVAMWDTESFLLVSWFQGDDTPPVDANRVYINEALVATVSEPATQYEWRDAVPGTVYRVRVVRQGTDGQTSDFFATEEVTAVAIGNPAGLPPAPTGLTVAPGNDGSPYFDLDWDPPPSGTVFAYDVQYNDGRGTFISVANPVPSNYSYRNVLILPGTTVFFRVRVNTVDSGYQWSDPSPQVSAVAAQPAAAGAPAAPTALAVGAVTSNTAALTWSIGALPPPPSTALAIPPAAETGTGMPSGAKWMQASAFYDSVGVNAHFGVGWPEGENNDAQMVVTIADLVELGVRHVRDSFLASFYDQRSRYWRRAALAIDARNKALPDGQHPIFLASIVAGWPGVQAGFGGSALQPTLDQVMQGWDGGHQHYDNNGYPLGNAVPNGVTTPNNLVVQPSPWNFADAEFPWSVFAGIMGPNEPRGSSGHENMRGWVQGIKDRIAFRTAEPAFAGLPVQTETGISTNVDVRQLPMIGIGGIDASLVPTHYGDWSKGTNVVDVGSYHPYWIGAMPTVEFESLVINSNPSLYNGSWNYSQPSAAKQLPLFYTEYGHVSSGMDGVAYPGYHGGAWPAPDDVNAEHFVRSITMFPIQTYGSRRSYLYTMWDTRTPEPTRSEANFGLVRGDHTKKPQFHAIKNLLKLVGFTEATTKQSIPYSITGFTAAANNAHTAMYTAPGPGGSYVAGQSYWTPVDRLSSMLLQQDNDTYVLIITRSAVIWDREPGNWSTTTPGTGVPSNLGNVAAGRRIVTPQDLTVTFLNGVSSVEWAQPTLGVAPGSPIGGSTPSDGQVWSGLPVTSNSVVLPMGGYTKLLRVNV